MAVFVSAHIDSQDEINPKSSEMGLSVYLPLHLEKQSETLPGYCFGSISGEAFEIQQVPWRMNYLKECMNEYVWASVQEQYVSVVDHTLTHHTVTHYI